MNGHRKIGFPSEGGGLKRTSEFRICQDEVFATAQHPSLYIFLCKLDRIKWKKLTKKQVPVLEMDTFLQIRERKLED